jgi:uncharacterized protein YdaL
MKFIKYFLTIFQLSMVLLFSPLTLSQVNAATIKTLVLYDAPAGNQFTKMGLSYAIMLKNLLGHFDTTVDLVSVDQYKSGNIENYQTTFYLGSYFDNPIPTALFTDISKTSKTIVWFKYNLWQFAWNTSYNFNQQFGFSFVDLRSLDGTPTASVPNPGFFDTIQYKNTSFTKYYQYNTATAAVNADPDAGITKILDATKATSLVTIKNSKTNEQAPYIVKSKNFWYFADLPFTYIGPRDRYLVLCDILHDILGVTHAETHKAMVRLEDVSVLTSSSAMKTLVDYMKSKSIPFSIALIPFYRDPLGKYNGGVAQEVHLSAATALKSSLKYAMARGGKIVMHGYTHQYNSTINPNTAVSGDDYEFWDIVGNKPVTDDSQAWASSRLTSGLSELNTNGFTPFAWEAPHYQSSPLSIQAVPAKFSKTYQRVVYYTSNTPNLNTTGTQRDFAVGQFFPYYIKSDYYGQTIIPENLGNIEYNICASDPSSCLNYTWQDLYTNAQYAKVVRDGVASFFFHPFWLEPAVGTPGFADFQSLVTGITNLGYTWTDASTYQ